MWQRPLLGLQVKGAKKLLIIQKESGKHLTEDGRSLKFYYLKWGDPTNSTLNMGFWKVEH